MSRSEPKWQTNPPKLLANPPSSIRLLPVADTPTEAPEFLSEGFKSPDQLKLLSFLGHYDVTTKWDIDDPTVDVSQYSAQLGYTRMQYALIPYGAQPNNLVKATGVKHTLDGAEGDSAAAARSPVPPLPDDEWTSESASAMLLLGGGVGGSPHVLARGFSLANLGMSGPAEKGRPDIVLALALHRSWQPVLAQDVLPQDRRQPGDQGASPLGDGGPPPLRGRL